MYTIPTKKKQKQITQKLISFFVLGIVVPQTTTVQADACRFVQFQKNAILDFGFLTGLLMMMERKNSQNALVRETNNLINA